MPQTILLGIFLAKASEVWARVEAPKVFLSLLLGPLASPALHRVSSGSSLPQLSSAQAVVLNSESQSLKQTVCVPWLMRAALSGRGCTRLQAGWVPTSL